MTEWRETPRHPRYMVSEDGRVKGRSGRILRQQIGAKGYVNVTLNRPALRTRIRVHVLVCEAFHGPKPTPKHEVAHYDGDKQNNRADNLRWATHTENYADMVRHGNSVLDADDVRDIRSMYAEGKWTQVGLARHFGVGKSTIQNIVSGRRWAWLDADGEQAS